MALDILSTIHTTYALRLAQKTEENYHCAADYLAASLDQLFQVNLSLNTLRMLSKEMGYAGLSLRSSNILVLSPLVPAVLTYMEMDSYWMKKRVIWLSLYYGQIVRSVNFIGIALLVLAGRYSVGVATALTYGFSYLSENEYFSKEVTKVVDSCIVIPCDIYLLVTGSFFDRLLSIFELAGRVKTIADHYKKQAVRTYVPTKVHGAEVVTLGDMKGMSLEKVQLDLSHLEVESEVISSGEGLSFKECEAALDELLSIFESIPWENHLLVLMNKLAKDKHWNDPPTIPKELYESAHELLPLLNNSHLEPEDQKLRDRLSDTVKPQAIQFFREGLQILVARLKAKSAQVRGVSTASPRPMLTLRQKRHTEINLTSISPEGYKRQVEGFYLSIAKFLKESDSEFDRANALLWLGVEGADYCGPQVLNVLRETEASLAEVGKDITLKKGILTVLYERRLQYIQNIWGLILRKVPHTLVERLGLNSPHWPNTLMAIYGKTMGAETIGSKNDIEAKAVVTDGLYILLTPLVSLFTQSFFSEAYTKESVLEAIQDEIISGRIPAMKVQMWFEENMDLKEVSDIWKVEKDEYSIKKEALILMLIKMRVYDHIL
ncbi:MAG: hypothetical protein KDK56_03215 [Simkania sp.]|nr:hypothetical protein [Simkania sp.]MCB1075254.1 hypothetical protein [Simkania sp.]